MLTITCTNFNINLLCEKFYAYQLGKQSYFKVALLTVNTLFSVSLCDYSKLPEKEFSLLKSMHYSYICLGDCISYNQVNST